MPSTGNSVVIHSALANVADFKALVERCMPDQGCVEVQNDQSGKEHSWHQHDSDETIVVLDGQLLFYWEGGEVVCGSGDVIELPRGVRHGSKASFGDVRYLISFAKVDLTR
ncbi:Acireductone dioxygenase [Roseovarius albus]|uniref:Acireductone dioxygenase n=1 Tax=Roseovarius albus TaxID=1247867 RepID=A0A1X6YEH6_9RHOB|nr:cupin domain-containing protein [Roseovarius albus]SLN19140.1 Acireductone dioxygenase [Roseovarius albus]